MTNSKQALKRIRQETCPATYMQDFNKKECCDVIEKDLEILAIFKKHIVGVVKKKEDGFTEYYIKLVEDVEQNYGYIYIYVSEKEYNEVKEWLKNNK